MTIEMDRLVRKLQEKATDMGAAYFGVADLAPAREFILSYNDDYLGQFPFALTAAVPMIDGWVDELHRQDNALVMQSYAETLGEIDRRWLSISYSLTLILQNSGYKALPIAEHATDKGYRRGVFSHKLAAHLAGLGWIGKNTLLITPEQGPRVRLMTVLTTAPLPVIKPKVELTYDGCKDCHACIDVCPVQALTGVPFAVGVPRDARLDFHKCLDYRNGQEKKVGARTCALCLRICPFGESAKRLK